MAPLRVRFIVTGDMEHAAFVESFRRALPHDVDGNPVDYVAATTTLQARKPTWFRFDIHPKEYLAHLVERSGGVYDETEQGAAALKNLSWSTVAGDPR
jgi:hypothetical protein